MNRREVLAGASAMAVAGCSTPDGGAKLPAGDPFSSARLMADVETYVGFGTHRTGSPGDLATSNWFARRWKSLGYAIEHTEVSAPNADTTTARLEAEGAVFDGFAQPPLSFTPRAGVTAPLVRWDQQSASDVSGRIAVVHVPRALGSSAPQGAYRNAFQRCSAAGAIGIVGVCSSQPGEPFAINTPLDMKLATPVLMLGDKHKTAIDAVIASRQPARLTILGPGGFRSGKNTIARRGAAGPWIIVSTPQSGWFTCGGERGPGIAMSLALSQWAAEKNFPCRFLFIATSGHEWVDAGAEIFHETQAPEPKDTALWFHLGAGFAARAYSDPGTQPLDTPNINRTLMLTDDLMATAQAAFAGQPTIEAPRKADPRTALGEYRLVLTEGYPSSAGFWGLNAHFHTPTDGVAATTGEVMEPVARAVAKVIEARIARI